MKIVKTVAYDAYKYVFQIPLVQLAEVFSVARVFNNPKDEYDSSTSRLSARLYIIPGVPIHRYPIGGGLCVCFVVFGFSSG